MKVLNEIYKTAFVGDFPDVPFAKEGVLEGIKEIDNDPVFITIEFARDNYISSNGMKYTPEFNETLLTHIQEDALGNLGHISDPNTETPASQFIWVGGTKTDDGSYFAKAYVWHEETAKFIKSLKATRSSIGTSIYGMYDPDFVVAEEDTGTFFIRPEGFELEYLDVVSPKRQALKFDKKYGITTQLDTFDEEKEEFMDRQEVINSLSISEIPINVIQQSEIVTDLNSTISELETERDNLKKTIKEISNKQFYLILQLAVEKAVENDSEDGTLVDYVRTKVLSQIDGYDVDQIEDAIVEVMESSQYKTMARAIVSEVSGGDYFINDKGDFETYNRDDEVTNVVSQLDKILAEYGLDIEVEGEDE